METTWILVADSAHSRIFSTLDGRVIKEVADQSHPQSRQHESELVTDRPGRSFDSAGQGRHAMEPDQHPHEQEAETFAVELAHTLEQGRNQQRFQKLLLIAPPEFLGRLRRHLSKPTAQTVAGHIDKNLVELGASELQPYVKDYM